uniref:Melanophilin-like n=2 Tax=Salarias fasciatus TaxID=181472 RepID=A0A672FS14_SALFA
MARVLKIGTLEWYHENVRTRFKRFGSAKVMRSLFKRLSGGYSCPQSEAGEPHEYDTQSMPEVHVEYEEHSMDASDAQYKGSKKAKRRLTVDPFDFKPGGDDKSRGQSNQGRSVQDILVVDVGRRGSVFAEADRAAAFLEMTPQQDYLLPPEIRTFPPRSGSRLSHSSCGSGGPRGGGGRGSSTYLPDDSDDEEDRCVFPLYQSHLALCSHTSQESLNSANPPQQITDLDRRMSAIETLLNRIEQKVSTSHNQENHQHLVIPIKSTTSVSPSSSSPLPPLEDVDLEELQLRQKLHELTDNISDHSLTSDEDEPRRPLSSQENPGWRSPALESMRSRIPSRPSSRTSIMVSRPEEELAQQADSQKGLPSSDSPEKKGLLMDDGSKTSFRGSTALLVELEGQVAQAAANVQNAQSEVSFLEDRIAALNAAGMPVDKRRRSAIPIQARRLSHNFPTSQVDRFVRNSLNRGSLTQRNPLAKPNTRATCAKPVMTQGS